MNNYRSLRDRLGVLLVVVLFLNAALPAMVRAADEPAAPPQTPPTVAPELFVPGGQRGLGMGTLELRDEAAVIGEEVTIKQICRWSDSEKALFIPLQDLVIVRLSRNSPYRTISVDEIKDFLRDAGVNLGVIRFAGARTCTVSRSDIHVNEGEALQKWIDAHDAATTQPAPAVATASAATHPAEDATAAPPTPAAVEETHYRALKDILVADLSQRIQVPANNLVVDFKLQDERVLNLMEPHFHFDITPRRVRNLGVVTWEVTIGTKEGQQKVTIMANAKAWQNQLVVMKPLAVKQILREDDLLDRRTLVDVVGDQTLLTRTQAVGQMAATDLKPGTVMTARMVDAVPLVKAGQLVTVTLNTGAIEIKSVAKATESGSFGQTIRVRNATTHDEFEVTITGPQQGRMGAAQPAEDVASARDN